MKVLNMTIKKKFVTLVLTVVAAFTLFGVITYRTVEIVKVSGPEYAEIVMGKDLTADILPPPQYILESYLTVMQMVSAIDANEREGLERKLSQLKKDFEDRQAYWKSQLPPGQMTEILTVKSAEPARRFYTITEDRLLPLLKSGKHDEAATLVMRGDLHTAYDQHRAAIDELVTLASAFSKESETHASHALNTGLMLLASTAIVSLVLLLVISTLIARSVTKPLGLLEARLRDIAQGEGDLTKRVETNSHDEIGLVAKWFNEFVDKIERVVAEVKAGAIQIDAGGSQIASASQSLAQGASQQASSLQEISASLEQISGQTQQSAENARQANTLAEECKRSADRGRHEMSQMNSAVNQIKQSSGEISKIIKVIDEIAFQTNLLALNAAVEAARAGEAGKGFAVVAEEVRNLAQRSAEAAKHTSTMIEESVKRSDNGVQIAGRVGQALEEITVATTKVNTLLSEIASAASEQATGVGQINQGVSQLDQVTQQNAGNSEELASSAQEMSSQVSSLNDLVNQFKVSDTGGRAMLRPQPVASASTQRAPTRPAGKSTRSTQPSKAKSRAEQIIPMESDDTLASF